MLDKLLFLQKLNDSTTIMQKTRSDTVLSPLFKVLSLLLIPCLALIYYKEYLWAGIIGSPFLVLYIVFYIYWSIKNPDRLQNEYFNLINRAIDVELYGTKENPKTLEELERIPGEVMSFPHDQAAFQKDNGPNSEGVIDS